jgi:hypothetical protein
MMHRIFIGYDERQPIACTVLQYSILRRASAPVAITPLVLPTLAPFNRKGLTPFTFSRFLVPHLCGFEGWALFLDIDVLCLDDIAKLFALADPTYAVQAVDTSPAFERAAVMLFNCAHPDNATLTPEHVGDRATMNLHVLGWTVNVGWLPHRWNHLVGYDAPRADAGLVHYTMGVPAWPETMDCEFAQEWHAELEAMRPTVPWLELMGTSVHAARLADGSIVPRYKAVPPAAIRASA